MSLSLTLTASQVPPYGTVAYRLVAAIVPPQTSGLLVYTLRVSYSNGVTVDVPISIPSGATSVASAWYEQILPSVLYDPSGNVYLPTSGTLYDQNGNAVATAAVQIVQEQLPQGYARAILVYGLQQGDEVSFIQTYASMDKNVQPNAVNMGGFVRTYVVVVPNFSSIFQIAVVRNGKFYLYTRVFNFTDPDPAASVTVPIGDNAGGGFDTDSSATAVVFDPADYDGIAGFGNLVMLPKNIAQFGISYQSQSAAYEGLPTSGVDLQSANVGMQYMSYLDYCASSNTCQGVKAYNQTDTSWGSNTATPVAYLGIYGQYSGGATAAGLSDIAAKIVSALRELAPSISKDDAFIIEEYPPEGSGGVVRKIFAFFGARASAAVGSLKEVLAKAASKTGRFVADFWSKVPGWVKIVAVLFGVAASLDAANNLVKGVNQSTALSLCSQLTQTCAALMASYNNCIRAGGQDCSNIANSSLAQMCASCGTAIQTVTQQSQQQSSLDLTGLLQLVLVSAVLILIVKLMR